MDQALYRSYCKAHAALRFAVADLRCELACRRFLGELKANFNPSQPRAPRGSSVGGQWIDADRSAAPPFNKPRLLDDGVFRQGEVSLIRTGAGGSRFRIGGNRPPPDVTTLQQAFPKLLSAQAGAIVAPLDNFLGLSAPGDAANLAVTELQFRSLYKELRGLEPDYRPPDRIQSLEEMSWKARKSYIGEMRLDRAAALYRRGEIEPLQVETLHFVQLRVDAAYAQGLKLYRNGELEVRLSMQEAIGNYMDGQVRQELRALYDHLNISMVSGQPVRVNAREHDTSGTDLTYRVPDARVGQIAFDWTLTAKTAATAQIRGFFNTDFRPSSVVIVRPSQLGQNNTYLITRPMARAKR